MRCSGPCTAATTTTQMPAALTQHDLTAPAAWALTHERPPHRAHEQAESVAQQFSSEHPLPASPLPVKSHESGGTCRCGAEPGPPLKHEWSPAEAHSSHLLPPHYTINVVLRLQPACVRSIPRPKPSGLDSSQRSLLGGTT